MTNPPIVADETYQAALAFLYERLNYERMASGTTRYPFGLQRITDLLRRLGLHGYVAADSPTPSVPLVHIAGTKGKGSTAAMVAAALSSAGLKTGLYTSPHLHHLEERFRIDSEPCSPADVVSLVQRIRPAAESMAGESIGPPSFFELTTAMSLLHFDTMDCQAIVLEVGLGGELDSTNACVASVTAVTTIGLDHQRVLGNTLAKIASAKAGIIKSAAPVVSGVAAGEAADVIAAKASEYDAALYQLDRDFSYQWRPNSEWGSYVEYHGHRSPLSDHDSIELLLDGEHQAHNAALALTIVDLLRSQGVNVPRDQARLGIGQLQCPGRIERILLADDVTVIVDSAHNDGSIDALCECLRRRSADRGICVVFGTSRDKAARSMLGSLAKIADRLVLTQFEGNPRFRPTQDLMSLVPAGAENRVVTIDQPIEACRVGLQNVSPGGTLVVCGSFFLAAETRTWLLDQQKSESEPDRGEDHLDVSDRHP